MQSENTATLSAKARNGEVVVMLAGGPFERPITHTVAARDRRAWHDLAFRLAERFGIPKGDTLNTIQAALEECRDPGGNGKPREAITGPQIAPPGGPWVPFPVDALPNTVQEIIGEIADAVIVDPAMPAAFALAIMAGSIGNTRAVMLREDWIEPCILWVGAVAPPGSGKTPTLRMLAKPIKQAEHELKTENKKRLLQYETALLRYEESLRDWRKSREGDPPEKPEKPAQPRLLTTDCTLEKVGDLLANSPRGLLMIPNELATWLDVSRYKQGQSDAAGWCQCFDGDMLVVDRITRDSIMVPRAAVTICGTIQPEIIRRFLSDTYLSESGLLCRMLLFAPPVYPRDWSENGVSKTTRAKWDALIRALLTLDMLDGVMGREPRLVELSGDAKSSFKIWCREIGNMAFADHAIGSWLSKLAGTTARIALAVHLSRCIEGTEHDANRISQESMLAAIKIGRWWANELRRCLDPLLGDEMHVIEAGVLEWVRRRGGAVTIAELARSGPRRFRNKPDEAEAVLSKLARLGHGTLEIAQSSQKGGRPKSVFRLVDTGYVDTKLHKTAVLRGFVSISNVSKPETEGFTDNTPNPTPPESGGTDSGQPGQPQRPEVDLDELNRRLAEAAEHDADAWVDFS